MTLTLAVTDVEAGVVAALAGSVELTAAGCQHVATTARAPWPMVRVTRTGGPVGRRLDVPTLVVDVIGPPEQVDQTREALRTIAATAVAVLQALPENPPDGLVVSSVAFLSVCQWLPDEQTSQGRFSSNVVVYCHNP